MKKQRIRWFHYLSVDAKAAKAELNALAERGWAFEGSFWGFARFSAVEGPPPHYCVEPCINTISSEPESTPGYNDYIRLCADAGWDLLEENATLRIFRSAPGADLPPVQTDPVLDYLANWDGILRRQQRGTIAYAAMCVFNFCGFARNRAFDEMLAYPNLVHFVLVLFLLTSAVLYGVYLAHHRALCKRAIAEGDELPVASPVAAKMRGLAPIALFAVFVLSFVLVFAGMSR